MWRQAPKVVAPAVPHTAAADNAIMIAATRMHTGKTSVSMAMLNGLTKIYGKGRVGYLKPVGHQYVKTASGLKIDKDAMVVHAHFNMKTELRHMSPIVIDEGYTRQFLDGKVDTRQQWARLQEAYHQLQKDNDFVVVEGTGHTGVGSIIGMSNAMVAARLGLDVVLVCRGGVGSTFDELELNRQLLANHGVGLRGVVVNKVLKDKYRSIRTYMEKAAQRWHVPLLACVPYGEGFDRPSLKDLELLYGTELLSGQEHGLRRFKNYELVTTSLGRFMHKLNDDWDVDLDDQAGEGDTLDIPEDILAPIPGAEGGAIVAGQRLKTPPARPRNSTCSLSDPSWSGPTSRRRRRQRHSDRLHDTCFVTHTSRVDIILGLLSHAHDQVKNCDMGPESRGGLLLTGSNITLPDYVKDYIENSGFPVLKTGLSTAETMRKLDSFQAKMHKDDRERTDAVVNLYEPHLDLKTMLASKGVCLPTDYQVNVAATPVTAPTEAPPSRPFQKLHSGRAAHAHEADDESVPLGQALASG